MHRHAVSMVLDHDVAADMVQDAFVRVYTHLQECRDPSRLRAWLFQTLRNRCLDHLKEPRRRHVRLDDAEPLLDPADGPNALAERTELRSGIAHALGALPPEQREAFVMHYVDGIRSPCRTLRARSSRAGVERAGRDAAVAPGEPSWNTKA